MEVHDIEAPATSLTASMLAHEAIKPTLKPAGEVEIPSVDCQHESIVQNTSVEPIRQDQFKPSGVPVRIGGFLPFVDPGEAMPPPFRRLADRRHHGCRLQPVKCSLEAIVIPHAGAAAYKSQDFIGC